MKEVGKNVARVESKEKVTGRGRYTGDYDQRGMLYAAVKTSPHAHAKIKSIDVEKALSMPGVRHVATGDEYEIIFGLYLGDKPALAREVVRHMGEPVAAVVADTYAQAKAALKGIEVTYEVLPALKSPKEAMESDLVLHPKMDTYRHIKPIHPKPGTNIANHTKIRKGPATALEEAHEKVTISVAIPPGDHVAMEPRATIAEIKGDGEVHIISSTQAPFVVKRLISTFFGIAPGKITVTAPLVGGGFGGKAGIQLEGLAYLLSKSMKGRPVKLINTREDDLLSSPGHIGLEATVTLGADQEGNFVGAEMAYYFDSGAYADYAVNISRAAAISCTGPYRIPSVICDTYCIYTNHPFATAYRGFGHIELAYAMETAIEALANKMGRDSLQLRKQNAIKKGDTTPVQSLLNENTGDLIACFEEVERAISWDKGPIEYIDDHKAIVRGVSGLWKAPAMPTNTDAGAMITFNSDGSCNVNTGVVEIGQGTKTGIQQLAAETLGLPLEKVHVFMPVNTRVSPSDWATAASRGLFMAGNAVIEACEDALEQMKETAAQVLRVRKRDVVAKEEKLYFVAEPEHYLTYAEVALGYMYPNGNAIGGQIIGTGKYIAPGLTDIHPETGYGHPDLEWTLGAEGVVMEVDTLTGKYKLLDVACAIDVGRVVNPFLARGQIVGGLAMGIGYTISEGFSFNAREQVINDTLRDYKIMRIDQAPKYHVTFMETPQLDGPLGARGLGEQSVIGMPGAIGTALARVGKGPLTQIPITPERVLENIKGGK